MRLLSVNCFREVIYYQYTARILQESYKIENCLTVLTRIC